MIHFGENIEMNMKDIDWSLYKLHILLLFNYTDCSYCWISMNIQSKISKLYHYCN
jgi:hypothetical protein